MRLLSRIIKNNAINQLKSKMNLIDQFIKVKRGN